MGNESPAKNPVTRILVAGSAIVGSTIYGAFTGDAVTASTLIISSVLDVIKALAPEVLGDAFHDKFINNHSREDILRNGDLARAVGNAISLLIFEESKNPFHKTFGKIIKDFGNPKFLDWEGYVRENFDKQTAADASIYPEIEKVLPNQLTQYFDKRETDLDGIETLTKETWKIIVKDLFNRKRYYPSPESIEEIAASLHKNFARALRKVLVDDFSRDGKAYASMQLRIVGEILSYVKDIHKTNRQILKVVLAIDEKINLMLTQFPAEAQIIDETFLQKQTDSLNLFVVNQLGQIVIAEKSLEQQTAQTDLQKRIVELLEKLSESKLPPEPKTLSKYISHGEFPSHTKFFTGRKDVLGKIEETLKNHQSATLHGISGLGKTSTALEYAKIHENSYQNIIFVRAAKNETEANFASLAEIVDETAKIVVELKDKARKFTNWLSENENWLLLIDNVDVPFEAKSLLPLKHKGYILATGNSPTITILGNEVPIAEMSIENSELLLYRRARTLSDLKDEEVKAKLQSEPAREREAVQKIVKEFDGLPLALNISGAYIHAKSKTFAQYDELFQKYSQTLLASQDINDQYQNDSVALAFSLAYDNISPSETDTNEEKQIAEAAILFLKISTFLAPNAMPHEIFSEVLALENEDFKNSAEQELFLDEVYARIAQFDLFEKDNDNQTFDIHRIVQKVLSNKFEPGKKSALVEKIIQVIETNFPFSQYGNWETCNRYIIHTISVLEFAENFALSSENIARCCYKIAQYLYQTALYQQSVKFFKNAIELYKSIYDEENTFIGICYNELALVYKTQGKYDEAIKLYKQGIEIIEKTVGKENLRYAISLSNLAIVYRLQDKYDEAIELYKQVLEIDEKIIDEEHPEHIKHLNNLALVYYSQDRYDEAIELYKQVLEISEKSIGEIHPNYAAYLSNLALVYNSQGKYNEAIELIKQAIEIDEKTIGKEHPNYALGLSNLASAYQSQDRYNEALPLLEESLRIFENTLPENHPYIQVVKENFEVCRQAAGK